MSTKEHKILPGFLPGFRAPAPLVGFGYDHCNDDYKVVCFYDWGHRAMFYSLRLNSWESKHYNRKIFRHCRLLPPCGGVYVDGAFNWRARHKDKVEILISLEFNTGNVRTDMRLPYHEHNDCVTSFDVLEGNLCVGFLKDTGRRMKEYGNEDVVTDIWVMKEFGNDESWTKLFSIRRTPYKPLTCIHGDQVLLLSSDANGDDKANLIYYNLNNKKFSLPVRIPELDYYFGRICHESLVPINQD
ncbi:hypothetical protein COLO4_09398 [Corchorus olitorius]|uniref:Uncharacterized protein n=1 Tax=Corchorus olitorius TaxID=93759 RepID=A0A1R3KCC5_9ROSI|nr:hypothetical protein COLO4_09398 [Corchorus olitorius]